MVARVIVVGYDPGGKGKSGVALSGDGWAAAFTHTGIDECLRWVTVNLAGRQLAAAGIDAPLSWATNETGLRAIDKSLQDRYPKMKASVLATNSIYGSAVVQGPAMAIRLREAWPAIRINETHPKVLFHALKGRGWSPEVHAWLEAEVGVPVNVRNDHEADALLSAIVTRNALTGEWPCEDLMERTSHLILPCGPVTYYWPRATE